MKLKSIDRSMMLTFIVVAMVTFASCGGDDEVISEVNPQVSPEKKIGTINDLEHLIFTRAYSGYLVVILAEEADEAPSTHDSIQTLAQKYTSVVLRTNFEEEKDRLADVVAAREELERLSGEKLFDWRRVRYVDVADPHEAVELYRQLKRVDGVTRVYPQLRASSATISSTGRAEIACNGGGAGTALLECHQSYLLGTNDGLNAVSAWNTIVNGQRVRGRGVAVVSVDFGINFAHEDLMLSPASHEQGGNAIGDTNCWVQPRRGSTSPCNWSNFTAPHCELVSDVSPPHDCQGAVAHGTAVAGVIAGKENGYGMTGFAPEADFYQARVSYGVNDRAASLETLRVATDKISEPRGLQDVPPGSIVAIEIEAPGASSSSACNEDPTGCLPVEAYELDFEVIRQAVAYGVTVIEGAGNGGVDLTEASLYQNNAGQSEPLKDLSRRRFEENDSRREHSGSILVGASWGPNSSLQQQLPPTSPAASDPSMARASFSNCGQGVVDAFAWGGGVATTGFVYDREGQERIFNWRTTPQNNYTNDVNSPARHYVNDFRGTSSSTAMVAGAAALLQNYAKLKMQAGCGGQGFMRQGQTLYLMPKNMRNFLVNSGVVQSVGASSCSIGMKPRIDEAMARFDTFWRGVCNDFSEVRDGTELLETRFRELRQVTGIGLLCKRGDYQLRESDPSCPDEEISLPGKQIGKPFDFDGDGRADLVSWKEEEWELDLSSVGTTGDKYGAWDVKLTYADEPLLGDSMPSSPFESNWIWPYVIDMNSDGRTDFVLYDKKNAKWYIRFTTRALLAPGQRQLTCSAPPCADHREWDRVVDYSTTPMLENNQTAWKDELTPDEWDAKYSRPVPGDYNGDGWVDIAVACSDGYWRIDNGGVDSDSDGIPNDRDNCHLRNPDQMDQRGRSGTLGANLRNGIGDVCDDAGVGNLTAWAWNAQQGFNAQWDQRVQYLPLNRTNKNLSLCRNSSDPNCIDVVAPGWAYLAEALYYLPIGAPGSSADILYKIPDGLDTAGRVIAHSCGSLPCTTDQNNLAPFQMAFGGNEFVLLTAFYEADRESPHADIGLKGSSGEWKIAANTPDLTKRFQPTSMAPDGVYGSLGCHPIAADFDGDGLDDRAVMCPNEWRIAYSSGMSGPFSSGMDPDAVRRVQHFGGEYTPGTFSLPGRSYAGGISYREVKALIQQAKQQLPNNFPPIPVDMLTSTVCFDGSGCN